MIRLLSLCKMRLPTVVICPVRSKIEAVRIAQYKPTGIVDFAKPHACLDYRTFGVYCIRRRNEYIAVFVDFCTVFSDTVSSWATRRDNDIHW